MALNGHVPWIGTVAVSGCTWTRATTRRKIWTVAFPGRAPARFAVTPKAPRLAPAVKTPFDVMVPPVALHSTGWDPTVSPAAVTPSALNDIVSPGEMPATG